MDAQRGSGGNDGKLSVFDRFATLTSQWASRAGFFVFCVLLQNTQSRSDAALQQKLNAIADALSDFMGELSSEHPELERHRAELTDAVGLERREGSGRR